jgi:proline dehydrogenase
MRVWQQSMIFLARHKGVKNFMQNRAAMSELARRFVGGRDVSEALEKSRALKSRGRTASLFYLGEYVEDLSVIDQTVAALKAITTELAEAHLDVFVCLDPTQVGYQIDEAMYRRHAFEISQEIKRVRKDAGSVSKNFLMLDMEDSSIVPATVSLYEALIEASLPAAITLQAYLFRTESDLQRVVANGGVVRLVKGAFAESKDIAFTNRSAIDASFMKLAILMLSDEARRSGFYPIFATHDDRLIEKIIAIADRQAWGKEAYEFEMLYGVRDDLQEKLVQRGEQLRLYVPFGTDWWPYAVRRVGESPKNARFLLRSLLAA